MVRPGTYNGRVHLRGSFVRSVTIRSEIPYHARLRHDSNVITRFYGQGITLEGFDIAHIDPGARALVIQIQDLIGEPGGDDFVSRITLRNNVLHDSSLLEVAEPIRTILAASSSRTVTPARTPTWEAGASRFGATSS